MIVEFLLLSIFLVLFSPPIHSLLVAYEEFENPADHEDKTLLRILKPELISILRSSDSDSATDPGLLEATLWDPEWSGLSFLHDIFVDPFGNVFLHGRIGAVLLENSEGHGYFFFPEGLNHDGLGIVVIPAQIATLDYSDSYNIAFSSWKQNWFEWIDLMGNPIAAQDEENRNSLYTRLSSFHPFCPFEELDLLKEVFLNEDSYGSTSGAGARTRLEYIAPMCDIVVAGSFRMEVVQELIDQSNVLISNFAYYSVFNGYWVGASPEDQENLGRILDVSMDVHQMLHYVEDRSLHQEGIVLRSTNHTRRVQFDEGMSVVFYEYEFGFAWAESVLYFEFSPDLTVEERKVKVFPFAPLEVEASLEMLVVGNFYKAFQNADRVGAPTCRFICALKRIGSDANYQWVPNLDVNSEIQQRMASWGEDLDAYFQTFVQAEIDWDWVLPGEVSLVLLFEQSVRLMNITSPMDDWLWGIWEKMDLGWFETPYGAPTYPASAMTSSHEQLMVLIPSGCLAINKWDGFLLKNNSLCPWVGDRPDSFVAAVKHFPIPEIYSTNYPNTGFISESERVRIVSEQVRSAAYTRSCITDNEIRGIETFNPFNGTNETAGDAEMFCQVSRDISTIDPPHQFQLFVESRDGHVTFTRNLDYYGSDGEGVNSIVSKSDVNLLTPTLDLPVGLLTIVLGIACACIWLILLLCFMLPCRSKDLEFRRKKCFDAIYYKLFPDEVDPRESKKNGGDDSTKLDEPTPAEAAASTIGIFVTLSLCVLYVWMYIYELEGYWNNYNLGLLYEDELDTVLLVNLKTFSLFYSFVAFESGEEQERITKEYRASYSDSSDASFDLPTSISSFDLIMPVVSDSNSKETLSDAEKILYQATDNMFQVSFDTFMDTVSIIQLDLRWLRVEEENDSVWANVQRRLSILFPTLFAESTNPSYKYALQVSGARIMERGTFTQRLIMLSLDDTVVTKRYDNISASTQVLLLFTLLGATLALRIPLTKLLLVGWSICHQIGFGSVVEVALILALYLVGIVQVVANVDNWYDFVNGWKLPIFGSSLALIVTLVTIEWRGDYHYACRHIQFTRKWCCFCLSEPFARIRHYMCSSKTFWLWFLLYVLCTIYLIVSVIVNIVFLGLFLMNLSIELSLQKGFDGLSDNLIGYSSKLGAIGRADSLYVSIVVFSLDTVALAVLIIVCICWKALKMDELVTGFTDKKAKWLDEADEQIEDEIDELALAPHDRPLHDDMLDFELQVQPKATSVVEVVPQVMDVEGENKFGVVVDGFDSESDEESAEERTTDSSSESD